LTRNRSLSVLRAESTVSV